MPGAGSAGATRVAKGGWRDGEEPEAEARRGSGVFSRGRWRESRVLSREAITLGVPKHYDGFSGACWPQTGRKGVAQSERRQRRIPKGICASVAISFRGIPGTAYIYIYLINTVPALKQYFRWNDEKII